MKKGTRPSSPDPRDYRPRRGSVVVSSKSTAAADLVPNSNGSNGTFCNHSSENTIDTDAATSSQHVRAVATSSGDITVTGDKQNRLSIATDTRQSVRAEKDENYTTVYTMAAEQHQGLSSEEYELADYHSFSNRNSSSNNNDETDGDIIEIQPYCYSPISPPNPSLITTTEHERFNRRTVHSSRRLVHRYLNKKRVRRENKRIDYSDHFSEEQYRCCC